MIALEALPTEATAMAKALTATTTAQKGANALLQPAKTIPRSTMTRISPTPLQANT
jgi:hypothetical protein